MECLNPFYARLDKNKVWISEGPSAIDRGYQNALIVSKTPRHAVLRRILDAASKWTTVWAVSGALDWKIARATSAATAGNPWLARVMRSKAQLGVLPYEYYNCQANNDASAAQVATCRNTSIVKFTVHHNQKSWI